MIVDAIFFELSNATSVAAELSGGNARVAKPRVTPLSTARALKRISEDQKCEQAAILLPRLKKKKNYVSAGN